MKCHLTIFLFLFSISFSLAQNVKSVEFEGLKKTRKAYLLKHLQLVPGKKFGLKTLKEDVQALKNFRYFINVEPKVDSSDGVRLTYTVQERITIIPYINFGGVKENFFVKVGFTDFNMLGRGIRYHMNYMYYERHSGSLSFLDPQLFSDKYGLSVNLNSYSTIEPLFFTNNTTFYDYDNRSAEVLLLRLFALKKQLGIGGTVFNENFKKNASRDYVGSPGPFSRNATKLLFKIYYYHEEIDYDYQYLQGFRFLSFSEGVWTLDEPGTFLKSVHELSYFQRAGGKGNIAARVRAGLSSNNVGPFAPFVMDNFVNIRGVGNRVDRGTGQFILNLEYRHTVWQPSWGALQLVAFTDIGSWRKDQGTFSDFLQKENVQTFFGGGVRVTLNQVYDMILRADFGMDYNDPTRSGFVLGVGQYF